MDTVNTSPAAAVEGALSSRIPISDSEFADFKKAILNIYKEAKVPVFNPNWRQFTEKQQWEIRQVLNDSGIQFHKDLGNLRDKVFNFFICDLQGYSGR